MSAKPYDTPSKVIVEEEEVIIDGPDGLAASFTADAAIETSERLRKAGHAAREKKADDQPKSGAGEARDNR